MTLTPARRHLSVNPLFRTFFSGYARGVLDQASVRFRRSVLRRWIHNMNTPGRHYVLNLPDWELPRLDDLEWPLVERLAGAARVRRIGNESLEDAIYDVLHGSLVQLAETAVNETLTYWLQGLGDGNDGRWPELCVELPYLERRETTEPLTLAYRVDNTDGTRTELNRTTLDAVIARVLEDADPPASITGRARIVAFALRQLADRLEKPSAEGNTG